MRKAADARRDSVSAPADGWLDVFRPSLGAIVHFRGLGTADPALPLLLDAVAAWPVGDRPVNLRLVLTMLEGFDGRIGEEPATTYERAVLFDASTFHTRDGRERVCRTALGSAAFPGVFAPVDVPDIGPCVDGGSVNNTPIKWAIMDRRIRRVIVVTTTPLRVHPAEPFQGLQLVSDLADILINERLYRDLRDAESANAALRALDKLVATQLGDVKKALGWEPIEIIQVRPARDLQGNAFSGFGSEDLRKQYVEAGRSAAVEALGAA